MWAWLKEKASSMWRGENPDKPKPEPNDPPHDNGKVAEINRLTYWEWGKKKAANIKKWGQEKASNLRQWWNPDKPKPSLPEASGAEYFQHIDKYPFENLVLKGGGAKGIAYIGACKILDEAGILANIKRFAGTSAGAITAALLAIGMSPEEMLMQLSQKNLKELLLPPVAGKSWWLKFLNRGPHFPLAPSWLTAENISMAMQAITEKGVYEGDEFQEWFGDILDAKLKGKGLDRDITFDQLHRTLGVELCIVAYNMVYGIETYFHVKTTPLMKIQDAVRMSMSIPVVFKPLVGPITFIDGGLAANYPLWAFDGWYLSIEEDDTFEKKLELKETNVGKMRSMFHPEHRGIERFDGWNNKTLGILMFSSQDRELYQEKFMDRLDKIKHEKKYEETQLYKAYSKDMEDRNKEREDRIQYLKEVGDDIQQLIHDIEGSGADTEADTSLMSDGTRNRGRLPRPNKISKEQARKRFDEIFSEKDIKSLKADTKEAFERLMLGDNGELTTYYLKKIKENVGPLELVKRMYLGLRHVSTTRQYYGTMLEFVGSNIGIEEKDIDRSVAIDVDYVSTLDFGMEIKDMEFLMRMS